MIGPGSSIEHYVATTLPAGFVAWAGPAPPHQAGGGMSWDQVGAMATLVGFAVYVALSLRFRGRKR